MNFENILNYRRSIRKYDPDKELDSDLVKKCIEQATLAPTSSNMQLWEFYQITNKEILQRLSEACLNQKAASTAKQLVVFVTRQDLYKQRAKTVLEFERGNIKRNSPSDRQENRIKRREIYYGKLMPFIYKKCFGLLGIVRKFLTLIIGISKPIVREVSEADMRCVVHKTCALAAQTFMLAMANQGYDTCPMEGFDSKRVKKILKLPRGAEVNMIISCGVRLPEGVWGERFRVPFNEVYHKI